MNFILKKINNINIILVFYACLFSGLVYVIWRAFYTIHNLGAFDLIWAILIVIAEFYTFAMFTVFSFISISKYQHKKINYNHLRDKDYVKDFKYFPTVDIFVCTYNENAGILKDTLIGCKNIKYPNKKIYVLDDGNRAEIKDLAQKFKCNYLSRDENIGFKAGNINNALKYSDGELIAIFDADHIPVANFLNEIIDFFQDNNMAVVQTPQYFFNPDPFQKNLNLQKYVRNEQDLFFRIIEPGLSQWNATIIAGTNFVIRRKHLEIVGGFPHDSITEDVNLGMRLQTLGYRVLFYNKPLAAGLSPETFKEFMNQRSRWAKGNLQIFLGKSNKYFFKLNVQQKLAYSAGLMYYFFGLPRIIFILSPILFLLFNVVPVVALLYQLIFFQCSFFLLKLYLFGKISKQSRNFVFTDVYETATAFELAATVIKTVLFPEKLSHHKFIVTNKGLKIFKLFEFKLILPMLCVLILSILAYLKTGVLFANHSINHNSLFINLFWNTYNTVILIFAIKVAIEEPEQRKYLRIPVNIEAKISNNKNLEASIRIVEMSKGGVLAYYDGDLYDFSSFFDDKKAYLILPGLNRSEFEFRNKIGFYLINSFYKDDKIYFQAKFSSDSAKRYHQDIIKSMYQDSKVWP